MKKDKPKTDKKITDKELDKEMMGIINNLVHDMTLSEELELTACDVHERFYECIENVKRTYAQWLWKELKKHEKELYTPALRTKGVASHNIKRILTSFLGR